MWYGQLTFLPGSKGAHCTWNDCNSIPPPNSKQILTSNTKSQPNTLLSALAQQTWLQVATAGSLLNEDANSQIFKGNLRHLGQILYYVTINQSNHKHSELFINYLTLHEYDNINDVFDISNWIIEYFNTLHVSVISLVATVLIYLFIFSIVWTVQTIHPSTTVFALMGSLVPIQKIKRKSDFPILLVDSFIFNCSAIVVTDLHFIESDCPLSQMCIVVRPHNDAQHLFLLYCCFR